MKRILLDIAIILSLFIMPWPVALILAIAGVFLFKNFYEFIALGVVWYALYGTASTTVLGSKFWLPIFLLLSFFILSSIKKYLIIYKK